MDDENYYELLLAPSSGKKYFTSYDSKKMRHALKIGDQREYIFKHHTGNNRFKGGQGNDRAS